MPSKLLRVKTAALAGLAALSIGGVATAATGLASLPAEQAATQVSPRAPGGQAAYAPGHAATMTRGQERAAATNRSIADEPSDHAAGPDVSGPAKKGLCQAWLAGQDGDHGRRADATAFEALAAAAGGIDQVPAYCQADPDASAAHGRQPATPPSKAPSKASPPTTGPPESPGQGHGQGDRRRPPERPV
jgi:hypothetical protein